MPGSTKLAIVKTAAEWKAFYARERQAMGIDALTALLDGAPKLDRSAAMIFPHTKLRDSGYLVAAVARAVVQSGCESVLALGVLHRGKRDDPSQRRIHGPEVMSEEFSLDNFHVLVELAAQRAGRKPPVILARFPFLTGDNPQDLPGIDELHRAIDGGAMLVATTDPVHHGAGYGTPIEQQIPRESKEIARGWIEEALSALRRRDYRAFLENAVRVKSDFRDVGPVLAELIDRPAMKSKIVELDLVDYAATLNAPPPTWVAAALMTIS